MCYETSSAVLLLLCTRIADSAPQQPKGKALSAGISYCRIVRDGRTDDQPPPPPPPPQNEIFCYLKGSVGKTKENLIGIL